MASRRRTHRIAHAVAAVLAGLALAAPAAAAASGEASAGVDWPRTAGLVLIACVALGEGIAFVRRR